MNKKILLSSIIFTASVISLCSCDIDGKKKMILSESLLTYSVLEADGYSYDAYMTNDSFLILKYNEAEVCALTKNITFTYEAYHGDSNSLILDKVVDEIHYLYDYNSTVLSIDGDENEITPISNISSFISTVNSLENKTYVNIGENLIKTIVWASNNGYYLINDDSAEITFEISYDIFNSLDNPYFLLFPCYDNTKNVRQLMTLSGKPRDFIYRFKMSKDKKIVYPYFIISCFLEYENYMYLSPYTALESPSDFK